MKKLHKLKHPLPEKLEMRLSEESVLAAITNLIHEGRPSTINCAGACEVRRHPALIGRDDDVHYTASHISIKQNRGGTRYWRKDKNSKMVDDAYDKTFDAVLAKFGDPATWFRRRSEIEGFVFDQMRPLIGQKFTAKFQERKNKGGHSRNKVTGKVTGGNKPAIQCHATRTAKIAKMLGKCEATEPGEKKDPKNKKGSE